MCWLGLARCCYVLVGSSSLLLRAGWVFLVAAMCWLGLARCCYPLVQSSSLLPRASWFFLVAALITLMEAVQNNPFQFNVNGIQTYYDCDTCVGFTQSMPVSVCKCLVGMNLRVGQQQAPPLLSRRAVTVAFYDTCGRRMAADYGILGRFGEITAPDAVICGVSTQRWPKITNNRGMLY